MADHGPHRNDADFRIVAKQPQRFGISTSTYQGEDIFRSLVWEDHRGVRTPGDQSVEQLRLDVGRLRPNLLDRPFVGGIDSTHTLLYAKRYGPDFPSLFVSVGPDTHTFTFYLENVDNFTSKLDVFNRCCTIRSQKLGPSLSDMMDWLGEVIPVVQTNSGVTLYRVGHGGYMRKYSQLDLELFSTAFRQIHELIFRSTSLN